MAKLDWNEKIIIDVIDKPIQRLKLVGELIEGQAKLLCHVDSNYLRGSITNEVTTIGLDGVVRIGTNVEYAPYVEFGTGEFAKNGQGRKGGWFFTTDKKILAGWLRPLYQNKAGKYVYFTYGSHPHPFLRPALLNNKEEIIKILTNK